MEGVHGEYVEYREILMDTLHMCGISTMEAAEMLDRFEVLVVKTRELRGEVVPTSKVVVMKKAKKGGT